MHVRPLLLRSVNYVPWVISNSGLASSRRMVRLTIPSGMPRSYAPPGLVWERFSAGEGLSSAARRRRGGVRRERLALEVPHDTPVARPGRQRERLAAQRGGGRDRPVREGIQRPEQERPEVQPVVRVPDRERDAELHRRDDRDGDPPGEARGAEHHRGDEPRAGRAAQRLELRHRGGRVVVGHGDAPIIPPVAAGVGGVAASGLPAVAQARPMPLAAAAASVWYVACPVTTRPSANVRYSQTRLPAWLR